MVAIKTLTPTRADFEFRKDSLKADRADLKPTSPFAGFIFVCSNETIPDLDRKIFGLPYSHASSVCAIKQGMPLFLFNYTSRILCGVFEAASDGGLNLDPFAWEISESRFLWGTPVSKYPAQVRVRCRFPRPPLAEESFRPILDHVYGHKFKLELTVHQVQQLLRLFCIPETQFFGDKSPKWLYCTKPVPESPRSAFRSDYDCYSECSSKGTSFGDDEWMEEDKAFKESVHQFRPQFNSEHFLVDRLQRISLKEGVLQSSEDDYQEDSAFSAPSLMGMPTVLPGRNSFNPSSPQTAWKGHTGRIPPYSSPQMIYSRDMYQMYPRFHEVDPAVYSYPVDPVQVSAMMVSDDTETVPTTMQSQPPYLGYENMIYIPAQAQPRHLVGLPLQMKGNELKKSDLSKQVPCSDKCEKGVSPNNQKMSLQQYPVYLQGSHYGQVLVPFCAATPIPDCDLNAATPLLSPVATSPYEQGLSFVSPQGSVPEEFEEEHVSLQPHVGGYHNFLQTGPFPVLLMPSAIPRIFPNPSPIATGFTEALHFNILQFARLTRPSAETQLLVEAAIDQIQSCVRSAWPQSDVEVFGSFATGLCLHHSDVDIAVVNAPLLPSLVNMTMSQASAFLLRELGPALKAAKCIESYNVIANASVPVLKCCCRPAVELRDPCIRVPSIAVDITIGGIQNSSYVWSQAFDDASSGKLGGQHTGGAAREYVLSKIQELPALAPLVLLMKSFLHHRGLSNVYLGGLGSFSLTLLLVYYLERVPSLYGDMLNDRMGGDKSQNFTLSADLTDDFDASQTSLNVDSGNWSLGKHYVRRAAGIVEKDLALGEVGGVAYLGTLLLGFLRTFGFDRDLARDKIVLKGMNGSPGGIYQRDNRHIAVWIDDPLRPGVNVAAGSFGMCQVQAAFREMLLVLANGELLTSPLQCNDGDCQDLAAFGQLFQLSQLLMGRSDVIK